MEHTAETNTSDKDNRMKNSFERYSDTEKSKEKDHKSKKKSGLFFTESVQEETAEKKPGLFEATEKTKPETDLAALLEPKEKVEISEPGEKNYLAAPDKEPELPENPEELSDGERQFIIQEILKAHEAELEESEEGSSKEAAALAKAAHIHDLQERAEAGPLEGSDIDESREKIADELGISAKNDVDYDVVAEAENIAKQTGETAEPEQNSDTESPESEAQEEERTEESSQVVQTSAESVAGSPEDDEAADDFQNAQPSAAQSPPSSGSHPVTAVSSGGGMGPGGTDIHHLAGMPNNPNLNPVSPDTTPIPNAARVESKYRRGADLLVGGIIGYLIGRRRGRIKTEERLLPVQKSLEKQVEELNDKLVISEEKVGKLASEKVAREGEDARKVIAEKVEARHRAKFEAKEAAKAEARQERDSSGKIETDQDNKLETASQPERRPERIAGVLLASPELSPRHSDVPAAKLEETVQTFSEADLLVVAAKIEINGQTAKQLYEQGRISREDLKEVVIERMNDSGKAERLLAEKLRPLKSQETMESATGVPNHSTYAANGFGTPSIWREKDDSADNTSVLPAPIADQESKASSQKQIYSNNSKSPAPKVAGVILVIFTLLALAVLFF